MTIPLTIRFHGIDHSATLEALVRAEADHLERFHPRVQACRVTIEQPQPRRAAPGVRIDLTVPGREIVARCEPDDVNDAEASVRDAFRTVRRQLQADAGRVEDWRHGGRHRS